MEKIKLRRKTIITYLALLAFTCMVFAPFLSGHYATDTYTIFQVGYKEYAINWYFTDGRLLDAFFILTAYLFHMPIEVYVFLTLLLALGISCFSVIKLKNIVLKLKPTEDRRIQFIILLMSYITIFHFMYVENMYFVDSTVMAISILCFVLAADIITETKKYSFIKALLLLFLGVISYQGTIGFFLCLVVFFTIEKERKTLKQKLWDMIKAGFAVFIVVVLNLLQVKLATMILHTSQTRIGSLENILNHVITILQNLPKVLVETVGLYPKYLFLSFVGLLLILIITYWVKNERKPTKKIGEVSIFVLLTIASAFCTHLLSLSSFYTGRLKFSIGALIGLLFIYNYLKTDIWEKDRAIKYVILPIFIAYFAMTIYTNIGNMLDHKKVNELEKKQVMQIQEEKQDYELQTDQKVINICGITVKGLSDKTYYPEVKNRSVLTYSALRSQWSYQGVYEFYAKEKLKSKTLEADKEQEYINRLLEEEKGYFFLDDTLYLIQYMY